MGLDEFIEEFIAYCKGKLGGEIRKKSEYSEDIYVCTLPDPKELLVTSKHYPKGDKDLMISVGGEVFGFMGLIPEDISLYVTVNAKSDSNVSMYDIAEGVYTEYSAKPLARRIEIHKPVRGKSIFVFIS